MDAREDIGEISIIWYGFEAKMLNLMEVLPDNDNPGIIWFLIYECLLFFNVRLCKISLQFEPRDFVVSDKKVKDGIAEAF